MWFGNIAYPTMLYKPCDISPYLRQKLKKILNNKFFISPKMSIKPIVISFKDNGFPQ